MNVLKHSFFATLALAIILLGPIACGGDDTAHEAAAGDAPAAQGSSAQAPGVEAAAPAKSTYKPETKVSLSTTGVSV